MRVWSSVVTLIVLAILGSLLSARERSPFDGVRFEVDDTVDVQVEETWWQLVAIDAIAVERLVEHAKERHGRKWQKRIGEDLPDLFEELGETLGDTVNLVVRPVDGGADQVLEDVRATRAKRRKVWEANKPASDGSRAPDWSRVVTAADWQADLDQLHEILSTRFAYLGYRKVDWKKRTKLAKEAGDATLGERLVELQRLLALTGDGHARVRGERDVLASGYLPFLLREAQGGVVAFRPDRTGFAIDGAPFVERIDGKRLDAWIDEARPFVSAGSDELVARRALERLRWLNQVRIDSGQEPASSVVLTAKVAKRSAKQRERSSFEVAGKRPTYGPWPRAVPKRLPKDVGYLRIESMSYDESNLDELHGQMAQLMDKRALIIDVRGNGGGKRDALVALAPYFLATTSAPVVANVAAYALEPGETEDPVNGHLANRSCYPISWDGWSDAAREVLVSFANDFKPDDSVDAKLSGDHFLVLERADGDETPVFRGPVIVLQDAGCFSATDIFLAGMRELPGVLTLGQTSSGGSARSRWHRLERTGLEFCCASMASWQPTGEFFDGNGVKPDVEVLPLPRDFLAGGADTQLARALEILDDDRRVRRLVMERLGAEAVEAGAKR